MNCLHLRFTPYDISGYHWTFLDDYNKVIVAQEDVDDNLQPLLHFHIYLETSQHIDTVRKKLKSNLLIPDSGRGVNNKYYALIPKWQDVGYICKHNNIIQSKGYTEKELMDYVISGKKKYLEKVKGSTELRGEIAPAAPRPPKTIKIPYQQQIISIAAAEWYNYKRAQQFDTLTTDHKIQLLEIVCKAMREVSRGVNKYLVEDIARAILFDDLDFREVMLSKLFSQVNI